MPDRNGDAQAAGRLARARTALEGLSVGDAFGERFFVDYTIVEGLIEERAEPVAPWPYTDDTEMALSIVASLIERGRIDQDYLAREFAGRYDPSRGYGPAMDTALRSAIGRVVVTLDCDDTYPAEEIPTLARMVLEEGYDVVDGSRLGAV